MTTLAEVLKPRGYRTGGFVGAFVLDRRWGIAQGFDRYFDDFDLSKFEMSAGLDADPAAGQRGRGPGARLAGRGPRAAVLRLGAPLRSAQPLRAARALPVALSRHARRAPTTARSPPPTPQVGRLLDALEGRAGSSTRTLVVVVGDHGEMLGEHGEQQHGFFIYDAAVHIPLIVAGPGRARPRGPRPGAHRGRDADGARAARAPRCPPTCRARACCRSARGEALDLLAFTRDAGTRAITTAGAS